MHKRNAVPKVESSQSSMATGDKELDFKKIMKDIEFLGSSHMTWKERKELENRKVLALGGKPPKKQRLPLSIARGMMKKQNERQHKIMQENLLIHGRFGRKHSDSMKGREEKRKPEDSVLKSSVGRFRNGVLDVKHMFRNTPSTKDDDQHYQHIHSGSRKGNKNNGMGKKNQGKKKGGGKRRH